MGIYICVYIYTHIYMLTRPTQKEKHRYWLNMFPSMFIPSFCIIQAALYESPPFKSQFHASAHENPIRAC